MRHLRGALSRDCCALSATSAAATYFQLRRLVASDRPESELMAILKQQRKFLLERLTFSLHKGSTILPWHQAAVFTVGDTLTRIFIDNHL
jgi:hypothetical protein